MIKWVCVILSLYDLYKLV